MQQAYRALRIVAEAQTIRVVLATHPSELMLKELRTACATLDTENSNGVKAVVLDFSVSTTGVASGVKPARATSRVPIYRARGPHGREGIIERRLASPLRPTDAIDRVTATAGLVSTGTPMRKDGDSADEVVSPATIDGACAAVRAVAQPVLAVVRSTLSEAACALVRAADLTLVANDALLMVPGATSGDDMLPGTQAARLGYVTWAVTTQQVNKEMERVLEMLRGKSAVALRHAKASVHLAQAGHPAQLEALGQVNTFYLTQVMQSADAHEGLRAFLEKRQPEWKNG